MPNTDPSKAPGFDGARLDFKDAPGADISFDELFPSPDEPVAPQAATSGTTPTEPPQAPTTQPDFFLKAGKSVYKTPEEAERGVAHKDDLIDRYRSFLSQQGINPDTFQSSQPARPQAQPAQPESPYKYLNHEERVYEDLAKAVQAQDPRAYAETLRRYNLEQMQEQFAPVAPLLSEVARQKAIREVSEEIGEFGQFAYSEDYRNTVKAVPLLGRAAELASQNFDQEGLREVYKTIYLVNQGLRRKNEPVAQVPTAPPVQTTSPSRPTTTAPSTMTPPQPSVDTREWTTNPDARKQLIKDMEARGYRDLPFGSVNR